MRKNRNCGYVITDTGSICGWDGLKENEVRDANYRSNQSSTVPSEAEIEVILNWRHCSRTRGYCWQVSIPFMLKKYFFLFTTEDLACFLIFQPLIFTVFQLRKRHNPVLASIFMQLQWLSKNLLSAPISKLFKKITFTPLEINKC